MSSNNKHRTITRRLALLGLFAAFSLPSLSSATAAVEGQPKPIAAGDGDGDGDSDDPPCGESVIALEIDTTTGDVYRVDGASGGLVLTDNSLNVYFGTLSRVLIDIEYSSGDWEVDVTEDGSYVGTYPTRGGSLRYYIYDDVDEYVFSSTEVQSGASAMATMAPLLPDVVIQPKKDCPPST